MKNFINRFGFIAALFVVVALIIACGGKKDETAEVKEDTKKEETTKRDESTGRQESSREETSERTITGSGAGDLYFAEDYVDGREIGVSEKFTPGWLTVMVDLRGTGKTLGTGKVELRITQVKDASGNTIGEKIIDTVPFDVQADWEYTYFQDKTKLKFSRPGTYKVTLQKVDGSPIVSGQVDVVSR